MNTSIHTERVNVFVHLFIENKIKKILYFFMLSLIFSSGTFFIYANVLCYVCYSHLNKIFLFFSHFGVMRAFVQMCSYNRHRRWIYINNVISNRIICTLVLPSTRFWSTTFVLNEKFTSIIFSR